MSSQDRVIARLQENGRIEEAAIELAREEQRAQGFQLSSHLLAMGFIDEAELLEAQAAIFELPAASYASGVVLDRDLIDTLGPEFVRHHQIVPVAGAAGPTLFTSTVIDPATRGRIADKIGSSPRLFCWPELRHLQALHNALGDYLPTWALGFFKGNPRAMSLSNTGETADITEALKSSRSLGRDWIFEELETYFRQCFDRDTLLKVLLGYAGNWLTDRMIAVVSRSGLQPYFVEDWLSLDTRFAELQELRKITVELSADQPVLGADGLLMGKPARLGLGAVYDALGATAPTMVVVVPVCIGKRTAMLLTGVPTSRARALRLEEVSESFDTEELERAAQAVGAQLEELIKRAKTGTLPPKDERVPPLPERLLALRKAREHVPVVVDPPDLLDAIDASSPDEAFLSMPVSREANHTQQLWAIDASSLDAESSAPGQEVDPVGSARQTQRIDIPQIPESTLGMPGQPATSPVDPRQTQRLEFHPSPTSQGAAAPDSNEPINPMRTSSGMPAVTIEDLTADVVARESKKAGSVEIDEGWDDLLDEASSAESNELAAPSHPFASADSEPQIPMRVGRDTLIGGFAVPAEGRPAALPLVTKKDVVEAREVPRPLTDTPEEQTPEEHTPEEHTPEEQTPEEQNPQVPSRPRHDSSSFLPGAQILKASKIRRRAETPAGEVTKHTEELSSGLGDVPSEAQRAGEVVLEVAEAADTGRPEDPHAWLDELEEDRRRNTPPPKDRVTVNTMPLSISTKTQSFGKLVHDMAGEGRELAPGPLTIPPEALEEILDSGPVAVELEQSLLALDSRNPEEAKAAAEHIATAGGRAVEALYSLFPGRLLVDRYQYTPQTLPPVAEHSAVLDALVRIGAPSLAVALEFLDHQSLELRFYATFLFTELPAEDHLEAIYPRLFDRDFQTRYLAQQILSHLSHHPRFEDALLAPLRSELSDNAEELRVEVAADMLRMRRDVPAIAALIDALGQHRGRVQAKIHDALRHITLQSFAPSISEWRNWWYDAFEQPRTKWLIDALNHSDEHVRFMAFDEIQNIPGLELNYHPEQPPKLRLRAQQDFKAFLEAHRR